jgi:uncharacterized alpha-E superfamily protein
MLSRVANALYWIGRNLERAEHVARLVDVNTNLTLDRPSDDKGLYWRRVVEVCGVTDPFVQSGSLDDSSGVGDFFSVTEDNPSSVIACVSAAREHGRSVRESISSEMWEQINWLYWKIKRSASAWQDDPHEFFQTVKMGCHLFQGLTDETMSHDEGYQFVQVGRLFERIVNTARLVDVYRLDLGAEEGEDPVVWGAVLKMCSAFEAYRRGRATPIEPAGVIGFLLFEPKFPRSALYCATGLADALESIGPGIGPSNGRTPRIVRLAGQLRADFEYAEPDAAVGPAADAFFTSIHQTCQAIEETTRIVYFQAGRMERAPDFQIHPQQ